MQLVEDLKNFSPNTLSEIAAGVVCFILGGVILLNPDTIWVVEGIEQDPILEGIPGIVGLLVFISTLAPFLLTGYVKSNSQRQEESVSDTSEETAEESKKEQSTA